MCLLLVTVTIFVYSGLRNNGFLTYDDDHYILENHHIQQGVDAQSITWAFTTFREGNWHPLTWISHIIDWDLYARNPAGYHITNLCLHAANAVLLFLLLLYITGYLGRSAIVAFLFALHPAHVESVAWIAERKDVLCTFFWFSALLAYAWYVRKHSLKRYLLIVCAFACALMSKPMAITFPFTLLLLDYWPLRRIAFAPKSRAQWFPSLLKLCFEKWPLFIMTAISAIITFVAQRSSGAVAELQLIPLWERICNAAISYWRYIRIAVWPQPLMVYYYYDSNHIAISVAILSIIALILVTAVFWHFREQLPYCLFGWLWFLGTLVPVIGIVQVGAQSIAERYTYVPLIGLFIAIVWSVGDAVANSPKIRVVTQLLAAAVLAFCAAATYAQVKVWKDTATLFSHVLAIDPRGEAPNLNLGVAYERQGKLLDAQKYVERAVFYKPDPLVLSYSAYCLMQTMMQTHDMRNLPLAGQRLDTALRAYPGDSQTLANMALWSALMGRPQDEEAYSRKAIAENPDLITPRLYLGNALREQGKLADAVQTYRQVLAIDPSLYDVHNSLGNLLNRQGLSQEALKECQLSLAIKPDQAAPHFKIGMILASAHQLPQAVEEFTQSLRIDPANANAHNDLGAALFQLGEYDKAAEQFSAAIQIDPALIRARQNLAVAQALMKNKNLANVRK